MLDSRVAVVFVVGLVCLGLPWSSLAQEPGAVPVPIKLGPIRPGSSLDIWMQSGSGWTPLTPESKSWSHEEFATKRWELREFAEPAGSGKLCTRGIIVRFSRDESLLIRPTKRDGLQFELTRNGQTTEIVEHCKGTPGGADSCIGPAGLPQELAIKMASSDGVASLECRYRVVWPFVSTKTVAAVELRRK